MSSPPRPDRTSYVDLCWLPLGGPVCELFHTALEVSQGGRRLVTEMAPVWSDRAPDRGKRPQPVARRRLTAPVRADFPRSPSLS